MNACLETEIQAVRSAAWRDRTGIASAGSRLRVWLVDNDAAVIEVLARLLDAAEGIGCDRWFFSAEAAVAALTHERPPEVLLLDIRMGRENGLNFVRPIKLLAPATHVVMLTTFYDRDHEAQALRDGASALLLKSDSIERILQCIREPRHFQRFPKIGPGLDVMTGGPEGLGAREALKPLKPVANSIPRVESSQQLRGRRMRFVRTLWDRLAR